MSICRTQGRHRADEAGTASTSHRRRRSRRTVVIGASLGALVAVGGGVAIAAWSISGEGQGDAQAITPDDLVVDDSGTPVADLFPGGTGDVVVRVTNPNPYAVELTSATIGTVDAGGACADSSLEAVQASVPLSPAIALAADSGPTEVVLPDAVRMLASATDACKGVGVTVTVTFSGQQV